MSAEIDAATAVLRDGGLVAFPTETVYGLGADATNSRAIQRLYAVKGRPADHPVIVHIASADALDSYAADTTEVARDLARACWPGPLTIVVRRREGTIVPDVTGGRPTVALRVPAHPVALALLDAFGGGVAAPSANRFGRVSPTTVAHVRADLGSDVDLVLDGGPTTVGVESTIVDCSGSEPALLRLGGVSTATVEAIVGHSIRRFTKGEIAAPGTLDRHYSPAALVVLVEPDAVSAIAAAHLAAGRTVGLLAVAVPPDVTDGLQILETPATVDDYARVLYARLREADERGLDVLLVVAPPADGIGAAITDRLTRAAAGRRIP